MKRLAEYVLENDAESYGMERRQMPTQATLSAAPHGEVRQVVMDLLAASVVGKFPPKRAWKEEEYEPAGSP